MTINEYTKNSVQLLTLAHEIECAKRPSYPIGSSDPLNNFKTVATRLGITPRQALAVYMLKHVDAVVSALKDEKIPQGEPIAGRMADLINYTKLAYSLIKEEESLDKNK